MVSEHAESLPPSPSTDVATDNVDNEAIGEERKQSKGKMVVDDSEINVGSEQDVDMEDGTPMGVNAIAISAQRAIFSLNRINLRSPPVDLKFGQWNDRPLKMNRAKELLATMRSQELRPFLLQNMLPIIIPRSDVDSTCLSLDFQHTSTSPMIKLTASGLSKGRIQLAGGRHRYHAVKLAVDETTTVIEKVREQIEKERAKNPKTDLARQKRDDVVVEMERMVKEKEQFMDAISTWGVILYDQGKCFTIYICFFYY